MESFCALNADFYFDFYSRIVARFRWNLNSKWNRGKSIEARASKRQRIRNLISRKIREKERENSFIYFSNLEKSRELELSVVQRKSQIREKNHSRRERLLTFLLKCEVFREMTALVIASKEKQCGWMAQLKCPQVQYALQQSRNKKKTWFFFNHIKLDISSDKDTREKNRYTISLLYPSLQFDLTWDEICKRAAWNSSRRLTTKRPTNCLKYFRGC